MTKFIKFHNKQNVSNENDYLKFKTNEIEPVEEFSFLGPTIYG